MSDSHDARWLRCTAGKIVEGPHTTPVADGMRKAADEIDRLRAENKRLNEHVADLEREVFGESKPTYTTMRDMVAAYEEYEAENDRLEAALAETAACLEWARAADCATLRRKYIGVPLPSRVKERLDRIDAALAKAKQEGGEL